MFACPSVKRTIGSREFVLRLDFNAVVAAETATGRNLLDDSVWKELDAPTLTAIFWGAASQTDPSLTLAEVRTFGFQHASEMVNAVTAAYAASKDEPGL
jgi:hypothetical protein